MQAMSAPRAGSLTMLTATIARYWGFHSLRPLQEEAMQAVLAGQDSLVVLPTGGGKSLCYQAPAVVQGGTTVVVSPLISLMKDQVDSLRTCGVPAARIDSSQTPAEQRTIQQMLVDGVIRLLFVSPERLVLTDLYTLLARVGVHTFAIDEAHCISHWGHDFRPEYRQLRKLKELFSGSSIHAYTATATERVRLDIVRQLGLTNPRVLVGNFDRPNLTYRVLARRELLSQTLEVLDRHRNEAGIVYCIRRKDVDELAAELQQQGYRALPYHAGMTSEERKQAQEQFAEEKCDVIVATVAFGMGIDRSNVRFVLHIAMPKTIEHYQQETGRAGRDGLEAECVLLYSGADVITWKRILEKSAEENSADPEFLPGALKHVKDMGNYCRTAVCRHRALVQYFGQAYSPAACEACDVCLGDAEVVPESTIIAKKILSCVARVKERFGVKHVVSVLRGENTIQMRKFGHEQLTTFGLLREHPAADIRDWIYQLIQKEVLLQDGDEYPILRLTPSSWEVMKDRQEVQLLQTARRKGVRASRRHGESWEGVDRELFEVLRDLRRRLADERKVPAYLIFSDATLRELARSRPSNVVRMRMIYGVGDAKLRDFGQVFWDTIDQECRARNLSRDAAGSPPAVVEEPRATLSAQRRMAFDLFAKGAAIESIMQSTGRARSTVFEFLCEYIEQSRPASIAAWIPADLYAHIAKAARQVGMERLRPIFVSLEEKVSYDDIRVVLAHLLTQTNNHPPE
jgi:ATP-dependent DNA helicase RecQ